jgi:hypothetical protein
VGDFRITAGEIPILVYFFHETAEEPYNAIVCQCLFEGNGNVFVCDGFFAGKQMVTA